MADNVTTQTTTLATIPTSTVIETRDQGSGVERQVVQTKTAFRVTATFTRPADTTAYATGDIVANSTTAASVTPLSFVLGNASAVTTAKSTFRIQRGKFKKSTTSTTNASFVIHLFGTDPSAASGIVNGDNGAFTVADAAYLGQIGTISTASTIFNDCAIGFAATSSPGPAGICVTSANATVYALIEVRAAYTPGNAEVFTITIEGEVD